MHISNITNNILISQVASFAVFTLFAATMAGYFFFPSAQGHSIATYFLALVAISPQFWPVWRRAFKSRLPIIVTVLIVFSAISTVWSQEWRFTDLLRNLAVGLLIITFVITPSLLNQLNRRYLPITLHLFLASGIASGIYSLSSRFSTYNYDIYGFGITWTRLSGWSSNLENAVVFALANATCLHISVGLLIAEKSKLYRLLLGSASLFFFYLIALSGSRSIILASSLTILVQTAISLKISFTKIMCLIITLLTVFFTIIIIDESQLNPLEYFETNISTSGNFGDQSIDNQFQRLISRGTSNRGEIWSEAIQSTIDYNFLLGVGIESSQQVNAKDRQYDHAHSLYVSIFHATGLIGIVIFSLLILKVTQKLTVRPSPVSGGLLAFCLAAMTFDGHMHLWKIDYLWFILWLPIGMVIAEDVKQCEDSSIKEYL